MYDHELMGGNFRDLMGSFGLAAFPPPKRKGTVRVSSLPPALAAVVQDYNAAATHQGRRRSGCGRRSERVWSTLGARDTPSTAAAGVVDARSAEWSVSDEEPNQNAAGPSSPHDEVGLSTLNIARGNPKPGGPAAAAASDPEQASLLPSATSSTGFSRSFSEIPVSALVQTGLLRVLYSESPTSTPSLGWISMSPCVLRQENFADVLQSTLFKPFGLLRNADSVAWLSEYRTFSTNRKIRYSIISHGRS